MKVTKKVDVENLLTKYLRHIESDGKYQECVITYKVIAYFYNIPIGLVRKYFITCIPETPCWRVIAAGTETIRIVRTGHWYPVVEDNNKKYWV